MSEIFSERSRIRFTENGNQILSWSWKHPLSGESLEILSGYEPKEPFFHSGSFLMYPWVNRHTGESIQLGEEIISLNGLGVRDTNGFPSHGLAYDWKRKLVARSSKSVTFELIPDDVWIDTSLSRVRVREEYSIDRISNEEVLTLKTYFLNRNPFAFRFCYGYHPYFRMKSSKRNPLLRSNLKKQIPLQDTLIPVYPIYGKTTDRFDQDRIPPLDSLFYGEEPLIRLLIPDESYQVRIQSWSGSSDEIPLSYVQIYTDFSGDRIAVEPMSAPGDAISHGFSLTSLLPEEEKSGCFQILLSPL
ncbi:aldose 1-epimerase [Leptospira ellisii]|uniref:Aldose 1-epimerase n=1 Tax=Leptospira ellisii TaxID=2023197 RepID=A0A2N0B8M7_9LEPT|nr:aldose epimerase [Leptospira ellisii]MDV6235004.1 aldose 1-epimerase [Leptospira ellisii]PJZ92900.1 aldose epimerase [Leptospira ellisii]